MNIKTFQKPWLILFLSGWMVVSGYPQPSWRIAKTITTESGLSNNLVFSIARDQQGFLWLATADGVSRFDGYTFKNYFSNPNDSNTPAVNHIYKIVVDRNNHVWIQGSRSTLQRYDRSRDHFVRYDRAVKKMVGCDDFIIGLDDQKNLIILGKRGLVSYDNSLDVFLMRAFYLNVNEEIPEIPNSGTALSWLQGSVYFSNLDRAEGKSATLRFVIDSLSLPIPRLILSSRYRVNHLKDNNKNDIFYFARDDRFFRSRNGDLWLAGNTGLYVLDSLRNEFNPRGYPADMPLLTNEPSVSWYTPGKGITVYDRETRQCALIPETEGYSMVTTFTDDQMTLWFSGRKTVSSENSGLIKAIRCSNMFRSFPVPVPSKKNEQWAVFAMIRDTAKNLWIGVNNLPYLIVVRPDKSVEKVMVVPENLRRYGYSPRAMCFDQEGFLWVGFLQDLLIKVDPVTGRTEQVWEKPLFRGELSFMKSFRRIRQAGNDALWIGGSYGFCRIDLRAEQASYFHQLKYPAFYDFHFPSEEEIWVANRGDLHYFREGRWQKNFPLFESHYDISMIVPGAGNILWLPMYGGGLCRFDTKTHSYRTFTKEDGLANNSVYCGLTDQNGNLWLSTNKGISRFNTRTEQFWNFDLDDGITVEEFNGNSAFKAGDGEMIFGGVGGYVRFYPDSIRTRKQSDRSSTLIYETRSMEFPLQFDSAVYEKRAITLEKGTTGISFHFTCTDLRNAGKISFRYRLNGHEQNWNTADNPMKTASYVNLDPGIYTFQVEASDVNSEWSRSTSLTVIIPPKFYQRAVFRILIAILAVLLISSILWFYIHQLQLTERKKQETIKLELLRSQLNPHFIFNALNPLNFLISKKDVLGANQYLADFSRLLRLFLSNSRSEYILLGQEVETIRKYLEIEQARFGGFFTYEILVPPELINPMPEIAPSMVQPFLENAILHGLKYKSNENPGSLIIRFEPLNPHFIRCIVEDNGIGISASTQHNDKHRQGHVSQGNQIIHERLALYNQRFNSRHVIEFTAINPGTEEPGTRVSVPIPMNVTPNRSKLRRFSWLPEKVNL